LDPIVENLKAPISDEQPCGEDLEDSQLLAAFDAYRVFGQLTPLGEDTDWRGIRDKALEGLARSKDLRLLTHLCAATLRIDGLQRFCDLLQVASRWFIDYPDQLFPRVDEDAILRRNALNCLSDRMAILDAVRRQPFVSNAQLGSFSLRQFEIATGKQPPSEADGEPPTESHLNAALAAAEDEELAAMESSLAAGVAALREIEKAMRDAHGIEEAPDFEPLLAPLEQIHRLLAAQIAARAAHAASLTSDDVAGTESGASVVIGVGSIRSREDAVRALDAVTEFFRRNEPSSPVPLFVERAKRLVAKDFLEVLADMAPDALAQAKRAGGIKDDA
jgi:type VI secretion system protein ImpA